MIIIITIKIIISKNNMTTNRTLQLTEDILPLQDGFLISDVSGFSSISLNAKYIHSTLQTASLKVYFSNNGSAYTLYRDIELTNGETTITGFSIIAKYMKISLVNTEETGTMTPSIIATVHQEQFQKALNRQVRTLFSSATVDDLQNSSTIDLHDSENRYSKVQIIGDSESELFSFVLQYSNDALNWFGDGAQSSHYLDTGRYQFSVSRTNISTQYLRVHCKAGLTVNMSYSLTK